MNYTARYSLTFLLAAILSVWLMTSPAQAHFIWLTLHPSDAPTEVHVHFSEEAAPDNPDLLDRITGAKLWKSAGRRQEPQALELTRTGDRLIAELPSSDSSGPVILKHTYGVLSKGGSEPFLLNYYAKVDGSTLPAAWQTVRDAERLPLEVSARVHGKQIRLQAFWQGSPQAAVTLRITGPDMAEPWEGTTDESGEVVVQLPESGLYSVLAKHEQQESGELEGKAYQSIRHYSTLSLTHTPARVATQSVSLPELPEGLTSFGAAILGDAAYTYGGNIGQTHRYHRDSHTGALRRLNLSDPTAWEELAGGPKLQGLALVAHDGALYRIGGFQARNAEDEDQSLWSHADSARYLPAEDRWESIPDLPAPRSSHDAAVLGDCIYVCGGWNMQGDGDSAEWHETVLKLDLTRKPLAWEAATKLPHARRGLSVAAHQGKLYVIGGMEEWGSTTLSVAIYDPETETWSEGPAILGTSTDGFGSAAFACGGSLWVSSSTGTLQKLSDGGSRWEYAGMHDHPRMFHRILPWQDEQLLILGGVQMGSGKVQEVELVPVQ